MLLQAGCRILYGIRAVDVVMDGGNIKSVVCYSKSGRCEIKASLLRRHRRRGHCGGGGRAPMTSVTPNTWAQSGAHAGYTHVKRQHGQTPRGVEGMDE